MSLAWAVCGSKMEGVAWWAVVEVRVVVRRLVGLLVAYPMYFICRFSHNPAMPNPTFSAVPDRIFEHSKKKGFLAGWTFSCALRIGKFPTYEGFIQSRGWFFRSGWMHDAQAFQFKCKHK